MLLDFTVFGVAIAALLFFYGWFNTKDDTKRLHFIIAASFVLVITGLFLAMNGLEVKTGESCLNYTDEYSHIWNCSNTTDNTCLGTPWKEACRAYNETQCRYIANCTWNGQACYGTPGLSCEDLFEYGGEEKCRETYGCYIWNETNPHECDNYVTYYYWQNCTDEYSTMDFNYSELIAIVLILVGIGTAVAAIQWVRTAE